MESSQTRVQFGKPISKLQAIQNKLAEIAIGVATARELVFRAAWHKDTGQDHVMSGAMAKLFASEMCSKAANHAVQVFGGYGYCQDYPVERYLRDATTAFVTIRAPESPKASPASVGLGMMLGRFVQVAPS